MLTSNDVHNKFSLILSIGYGLYIIIVLFYTFKQCNTLLNTTSVTWIMTPC